MFVAQNPIYNTKNTTRYALVKNISGILCLFGGGFRQTDPINSDRCSREDVTRKRNAARNAETKFLKEDFMEDLTEAGPESLEKMDEGEDSREGKASKKEKSHEERKGLPKKGRIRVPREGQADLEFSGAIVAEVEGYHGESVRLKKKRWTRLTVYNVEGVVGKYVCVVTYIAFGNQPPVYLSKIFEKASELVTFTGHSFLAKRLYKKLGLEEDVEKLN